MRGAGDGLSGGGSGVELPGAVSDGVRRGVEHGNSESAMRRTEEPGGLVLAPVEPQVRHVR